MPCRREEEEEAEGEEEEGSFLLLEQTVTLGGSGEVDRLGGPDRQDAAVWTRHPTARPSPGAPPGPPLQPPRPPAASLRLPRVSAEAGSRHPGVLPRPCRREWLQGSVASRRLQQRRWTHAAARAGSDDDPHRLLQQLVLSGNLIKEAVRRLQRAVAAVAATSPVGTPGPDSASSGPERVALQTSGNVL
uniref:FRAT regulator of WNT signaling pathway 2 n=1 Tax=Cavia porcellus TaxID=10141 RepID=H0WCQ4_CAVPO